MRLNISIEINTEDEDVARAQSVSLLQTITESVSFIKDKTQVSLTREGDRSGKNLLLPRLEGRVGNHLQSRKAKLGEIIF